MHVQHWLPRLLHACPGTEFIFRALTETDCAGLNIEVIAFNCMMCVFSDQFRNLNFYDTCILPRDPRQFLNFSRHEKGVHLQQWAALELYGDLIRHALFLANPVGPPPGRWPLRPFYRYL